MPAVFGDIGTTGLIWNSGFGYDPVTGQPKAQKVNGKVVMLDVPTDPGGTKNWTPPKNAGIMSPNTAGGGAKSLTGVSTSGPGGYNINAQIDALNRQYKDSQKLQSGAAMEQQAMRNNFSSDFGAQEVNRLTAGSEAERLAAIERLMNQKSGFDFQREQSEWERANQPGAGEGRRYGNANESQQMQELLKALGGGGGGGGPTYSSKQMPGTGTGAPMTKPDGEPIRGSGESFDAFNSRWQSWFRNKTKKSYDPTAGMDKTQDLTGGAIDREMTM